MASPFICSVGGCGKPAKTRGLCGAHYESRPGAHRCSIDGCDMPVVARSWCRAHYKRWRRYGTPLGGGTALGEARQFLREAVLPYKDDDCLIWPFARRSNGYATMWDGATMGNVCRIVCEHVHGPAPTPKHEAAHSCGKGHEGCCNPRHLSWKTPSENQMDRVGHGTSNRGARNIANKLSESEVLQIRTLKGRVLQRDIAKMFGVSRSAVSAIHAGRTWGWFFRDGPNPE